MSLVSGLTSIRRTSRCEESVFLMKIYKLWNPTTPKLFANNGVKVRHTHVMICHTHSSKIRIVADISQGTQNNIIYLAPIGFRQNQPFFTASEQGKYCNGLGLGFCFTDSTKCSYDEWFHVCVHLFRKPIENGIILL